MSSIRLEEYANGNEPKQIKPSSIAPVFEVNYETLCLNPCWIVTGPGCFVKTRSHSEAEGVAAALNAAYILGYCDRLVESK
jgi:hypothetical protein